MSASVAIVILNYNGQFFLEKFLENTIKKSNVENCSIWVADNNSSDNSVEYLKKYFPKVNLIELNENTGYTGGYNKALSQIKTDYFVLLNSDIEVTENWISPIIELMEKDKTIAACQPKILDYNNKSKFEYAGASGGFIDKYGYPFCRGRVFENLEEDKNQYNSATEIFWATGACMFVRANSFFEAGALEEKYFAHMEEIDLCWRFKSRGYKIFVEPKSAVYHVGGGTLNKVNPKKTYLNFRNSLLTLVKNEPTSTLVQKVFIRLILDGIAGIKFLAEGDIKHTVAVIKAHFGFYRLLPYAISKRNNYIKITDNTVLQKSIVFEYFLKKKTTFSKLFT